MQPTPLLRRFLYRLRPARLSVLICQSLRVQRAIVHDKDGHPFWVHPVSHLGNELIEQRIYERELVHVIQTLLRPGDTFVDVGANEGYFSVLGAHAIKGGVVHSIEPQSRLQSIIEKNLQLNEIHTARLHKIALSSLEGEETLHLTSMINSGGSSFSRRRSVRESEIVPTTTLDIFFRKHALSRVRLIKIDCEGAELSILQGASDVLSKQIVDFWSIDYHPSLVGPKVPFAIDGMMRKAGYVLTSANKCWLYHLPQVINDLHPLQPLESIKDIA